MTLNHFNAETQSWREAQREHRVLNPETKVLGISLHLCISLRLSVEKGFLGEFGASPKST
jgi:hypothetical protein